MNKKAYEFSFAWIFTIFIGAAVIFFAVYAATQLVETKRVEQETVTGQQIGILLTPAETNLEEAKITTLSVSSETQIFNGCDSRGTFGEQKISTKIKSGIGEEWRPVPGVESSFHNKYIFSSGIVEGEEKFYVLSKPFNFPFKVADLIIIWPDKELYCFVNANYIPELKQEIENLELDKKNIFLKNSVADCPSGSKAVCFSSGSAASGCDIIVSASSTQKTVTHILPSGSATVQYVESLNFQDKYGLLYAAIFSEPEIYSCQVERILGRAAFLAQIYQEKSLFLEPRGCGGSTRIQNLLGNYFSQVSTATAGNLASLEQTATEVRDENEFLSCELF